MRRFAVVLFFLFLVLAAGTRTGGAQAVESADARPLRIDAGGMVSSFQPGEGTYYLIGGGTYVDVHFTHWFQLEGEGRWLRFNQYFGETQDHYLVGPRVPIKRIGRRSELYGKALIGYGKMTFPYGYGYGTFTDMAFGASLDYRASRKLTLRMCDFEYQYWPKWLNNETLTPYGLSVGVAYRVY